MVTSISVSGVGCGCLLLTSSQVVLWLVLVWRSQMMRKSPVLVQSLVPVQSIVQMFNRCSQEGSCPEGCLSRDLKVLNGKTLARCCDRSALLESSLTHFVLCRFYMNKHNKHSLPIETYTYKYKCQVQLISTGSSSRAHLFLCHCCPASALPPVLKPHQHHHHHPQYLYVYIPDGSDEVGA